MQEPWMLDWISRAVFLSLSAPASILSQTLMKATPPNISRAAVEDLCQAKPVTKGCVQEY